jgi:hypothetical protein
MLQHVDQGVRIEVGTSLIRLSIGIGEAIPVASHVASYLATGEYETRHP